MAAWDVWNQRCLTMQLIFTPMIWRILEQRRHALGMSRPS